MKVNIESRSPSHACQNLVYQFISNKQIIEKSYLERSLQVSSFNAIKEELGEKELIFRHCKVTILYQLVQKIGRRKSSLLDFWQ